MNAELRITHYERGAPEHNNRRAVAFTPNSPFAILNSPFRREACQFSRYEGPPPAAQRSVHKENRPSQHQHA